MKERVAVIGLGYVGLPLAIALARHLPTVGFDIDAARVAELVAGRDRTGEVDAATLAASSLLRTTDVSALRGCSMFIVTVPTPIDAANRPDLTAVRAACRTVGAAIGPGAIVVLESTVYPGVTEDVCGPEIARVSGLACGRDFLLGYSPERINPGDREHTVERITKVVAGQTPEALDRIAAVYAAVTSGGVFRARDIRTAEAAKVIENAQRDINIAFVNEITMIFRRLGVSVHDVLAASRTKWNFLPFAPGLVGGHCIGVDPYYLADLAQRLGHHPEVVLAGRRINDRMGHYVADELARALARQSRERRAARVLMLGLTFKEDVPDLRNSKVIDVIRGLEGWGHEVLVHDPHADRAEAKHEYGVDMIGDLDGLGAFDCVVAAVAHRAYAAFDTGRLATLTRPGGVIADVKGVWRSLEMPPDRVRWEL
ncbi:MAG: nucleotide sugar dehydrogenase [Rhodospirillales bacterium]|jgi:UDP-N-acetyl-D-galactosamine dehydrogenase